MVRLIYRLLIIMLFLLTANNDAQWYEKSTGLPSGWGTVAIDACDSLTSTGPQGFNPDSLFITTDGGNKWLSRPRPSVFHDIEMINNNKIWCSNWNGEIFATSDGGFSWELQYYHPSATVFMNYIEMFDSLNGIAMGDAPSSTMPALFLKTTNGGTDWISQNDSSLIGIWSGDIWRRIDFVNENLGYFFSTLESPQKLYKTTNSGKNWEVLFDTAICQVIKFYDENLGIVKTYACSSTPGIYRTTNGGENWEVMTNECWEYGEDIEFIPGDPSKVWIVDKHAVYFSSDTGRTWTEQFSNPDAIFWDIVFVDSNHGWLTGWYEGGVSFLFYTSNGGMGGLVSVETEDLKMTPEGFLLYQNFPNPFNPITTIKFEVSKSSPISLIVYDVLGREIIKLFNEFKPAGTYELTFDGSELPSGIYFYTLTSGNFISTKKLVLLK